MSDYSSLKIELIGTGTQAGSWGATTNTNLGTAIEQAIGGKADVTMSSTTKDLMLTNTNAAQDARALYLNLTGTPGGAATLNVPAVQKAYIVHNGTTGGFAVTVKVTGQTGVSVPNGATMHLYNNGTDVVNAMTNLPAGATIGGSPIGTGGGSVTSVTGTGTVNGITLTGNVTTSGNLTLGGALTNVDLNSQVTGTLPTNRGGTGQTATQYCNLATNVSGTLPVANGGTGAQTLTANAALIGNGTGAVLGLSPGTNGNVMTSNGSTWTSTGAVNSFSAGTTGFTPSTATTGAVTLSGTLNAANGGTGRSSLTSNNLVVGNGTSAVNFIAPGTDGQVLVSNSGTWAAGNVGSVAVNSFSGGTTGLTPNTATTGAVTLAGTLSAANGGTGRTSLTANNVLLGNGTSSVNFVAPGTNGQVLVSNGTTWAAGAIVNSISGGTTGLTPNTATTGAVTLAGTLAVANGGTGADNATNARINLAVPSITGGNASGTWNISISGNAATVTTITTNQVLNATASASAGGVGTYGFFSLINVNQTVNIGATLAGSALYTSGIQTDGSGNSLSAAGASPSGTWRCMGYLISPSSNWNNGSATVFLRIS